MGALIVEPAAELVAEIRKTGIEPASGEAIAAAFAPHFRDFHAIVGDAAKVEPDAPQAARAMRLRLKAVRVAGETTRKALKADVLLRGRAIDGVQALLELSLVPVERAMEAIETAEARREAARKQALADERRAELAAYCDPAHYQLGDMDAAAYAQLLAGAKAAKANAEAAAEAVRLQAEADAKALAEAHAAKVAAAEAERKRLEQEAAEAKAAKAEADRLLAVERQAAAEAAAKTKAIADAQAAEAARLAEIERARLAEIAATERQAAAQARAEADRLAKIESARIAAEQATEAARLAAAAHAAAAPTREKLAAFAVAIRALPVPQLGADHAELQALLHSQVAKFAAWVDREVTRKAVL